MKYINNSRSARTFSLRLLSIVVKSFYGLGWLIAIGLLFSEQPVASTASTPDVSEICVITSDVPAGQALSSTILDQTQILSSSVTTDMIEDCTQVNFSRPLILNSSANSVVLTSWFAPEESLDTSMLEAIQRDRTIITMLASDFHVLPSELTARQEVTVLKANKQANSVLTIANHVSVLAIQPVSEKDALITFSAQTTESLALAQSLAAGDQLHLIYTPKHATPTPKATKKN